MSEHEHVLIRFHAAAKHAEIAVKCTFCFRVWAGNLPEVSDPLSYYSPDEAAEMRQRRAARPQEGGER